MCSGVGGCSGGCVTLGFAALVGICGRTTAVAVSCVRGSIVSD